MTVTSSVKLTIHFNDPDLEPEEQDEQVQRLIAELNDIDEVESVNRVLDPNPPEGNKSLGGFLLGLLIAEVNTANAKKLIGFLSDRLGGKLIELSVEANGKKLTVKAHSREELEAAIKAAQDFIADRLRQTQQQLELADRDIAAIESQITAEVEAYHQKLQDYERLFFTATQQEYPLSEATRNDLRQQQQRLGLTDVDVAPIEAQITTQIESYHQKLQQYEQAFVKATQCKHYPDEVTQQQLQQTWQTLGLSEGDVGAIERRINAEIETYQANLRQYEQEFTEGVQQEYPLSTFKRSQLTQRHQALNLTAEDVTAIENPIVVAIEEHRQKLHLQQSSPAQHIQSAQERITRQKFLKWAGLGGVGLVTAVVGREIFKGQSSKYIPVKFETFKFETVTVDEKGQVIKRDSNKQAKFFKEDLGNGITLEMIEILAGSFKMGSPPGEIGRGNSEEPQRPVNVPAFFMGKFEVTQEQYQQMMGTNPSYFNGAKRPVGYVSWNDAVEFCKKRPVENVFWNDAVEFCKKLSQKTGRKYRLPSEAEWEYACRAGTTTPFHFGETITIELANYNGSYPYASAPKGKYRQETTQVGSFPPNAFGLYDMHGNVGEWCQDTWHDSYQGAPSDGSAWIDNDNQDQILRGGSLSDGTESCRSASRIGRLWADRDHFSFFIGFRVVCAFGRILQ